MQIPILHGIYTNDNAELRTQYPRNLIPVLKKSGVAEGFLRPAYGAVQYGTGTATGYGPGISRGGINWKDVCYRVMGTELVSIDSAGKHTALGTVDGTDHVSMAYSEYDLGIAANGKFYLYNSASGLRHVTSPYLGTVKDLIYESGYWLLADDDAITNTELGNPETIEVSNFVRSNLDPDPINALLRYRKEVYCLNRYTIEVFGDSGGLIGSPYIPIESAAIERGCIGTHCCCVFNDSIAFLGGGHDESISVWTGLNGSSSKIATRDVDLMLSEYPVQQLRRVLFEARTDKDQSQLWIHLPDKTLVYDHNLSAAWSTPIWYVLTSGLVGDSQLLYRDMVQCYGKTMVAHANTPLHGYLVEDVSSHWGSEVGWEFSTPIMYAEGKRGIIHQLELVVVGGGAAFGDKSTIWTNHSHDGQEWSTERGVEAPAWGERDRRLVWMQQGAMRHWRVQKFRGTSRAHLSVLRLEAQLEGLNA